MATDSSTVSPSTSVAKENVHLEAIPLRGRLATLTAILLPFLGLIAAVVLLWGWGFTWTDFGLLVGMYLLTAIGITVGFHRLFVHRSFETFMWIKFLLGIFGSMAVQGSLFNWVAQHRRHHQHSDEAMDPHSPHHYGGGVWGRVRGFWHAHIGWAFKPDPPNLANYIKDLHRSPTLRVVNSLFPFWILLGLIIPALVGGLVAGEWVGAWRGLLWGGLARMFIVHHVTWSVNSAGHLWGTRPYRTGDQSRDNFIFGILALGEGWHNAHHAFPTSARHGLRWWKIDMSYAFIRLLGLLRLAWDIKVPTESAMDAAGANLEKAAATSAK
jgi:stearoyl-CoA desaturase (Delta-9 desaturase)